MIILGLDQSSNSTGYSVYKDGELIKYGLFNETKKIDKKHNGNTYYQEKIKRIKEFMKGLIDTYKVDIVTIEDIQSQKSPDTFKKLAWLQSALIQYLYEQKIKYAILKPSEWRNALKIKGKTRKREDVKKATIEYVKKEFDIDCTDKDDISDAICIGYASVKLLDKNKLTLYT